MAEQINKRIAIIAFLLFIITPSVASAAWWNPFTWFKQSAPVSQVIAQPNKGPDHQVATTTQKEDPRPTQKVKAAAAPTSLPILSNKQIIALVKPAIVYIEVADGEGSGMIIQSTATYSYILTNAHVVQGVSSATVTPQGGHAFIAVVVGRDEKSDVAVLRIPTGGLPSVILGDSDALAQGDKVFALGYPFGIRGDAAFTDGVVSKTNAKASSGKVYIQNTVEIHPGNSGGALVNQYGRVVGITSANYGDQIQGVVVGETVKLAIPINTAKALIPQLENGLNVTSGIIPISQFALAPTTSTFPCLKFGALTEDIWGIALQLIDMYGDDGTKENPSTGNFDYPYNKINAQKTTFYSNIDRLNQKIDLLDNYDGVSQAKTDLNKVADGFREAFDLKLQGYKLANNDAFVYVAGYKILPQSNIDQSRLNVNQAYSKYVSALDSLSAGKKILDGIEKSNGCN